MTTAKNGKRSVVLFLCHLINAQVIKQYRKLCRDIGKEYDIYWVFQTDNGISEKGLLTKGTKVFMFSMNDLNTLGYSYLEKLYGSEHYIMEGAFRNMIITGLLSMMSYSQASGIIFLTTLRTTKPIF